MLKKTTLALAVLGATSFAQADVLTTLQPIGFIASAITDGVTETRVLLPASASPHDYSLKPSDVEKLQSAQLIVWVGDEMEGFLEKSLEKFPESKVLALEDVPAIQQIVAKTKKEDGDDHDHDKDHDHKAHDHSHKHDHEHHHAEGEEHHHHNGNWHVWISPEMGGIIAEQIADRLSQQLPEQKEKIAENLANFKTALAAKNSEIRQQLAPHHGKGYYTFHDAYGYFEDAYGLTSLGSFTINPSVAPGAKTLKKIKTDIAKHRAVCLFAEPQFTPKVIDTLAKNTKIGVGQLDPLGAKITLSKTAYPEFLQSLANDFDRCLSK